MAQTAVAGLFGGWGLWRRNAILSQPLFDGTFWDTTARFHVWPWPYKFASVANMPSFLAGVLLAAPVDALRPGLPELVLLAPSLPVVYLLWYWVGRRFDRRWTAAHTAPWIALAVFTAVCLGGAFIPRQYGGLTVYLPFGVGLWLIAVPVLLISTRLSSPANPKGKHLLPS